MRTLLVFIFLTLSIPTHAQLVKSTQQDEILDSQVNSLVFLLQDIYSQEYKPYRAVFDIPENRKVVVFSIESYYLGNNSYQFLAVFRKSQRQETETSTPYGPITYKLLGYLQIGAHHMGSMNLDAMSYENNVLRIPLTPDRFSLTVINSEIINKALHSVTIKINEHSLKIVDMD